MEMTFPWFALCAEESARAEAAKVGVLIIVNAIKVKKITRLQPITLMAGYIIALKAIIAFNARPAR
jgi:energy-converting hydrogenase Eha subunit B